MKRDPNQLTRTEYDLLVVGGGIYGVCVAWDAILRGLSVALVEKRDFGHATSSNTLRIIHGGLRYLQHGDIRRLRRSIHERRVFMQIAPHLVHPLPFFIPTYGHLMRGKEVLSLALVMNDVLGFSRTRLEDPQKDLPPGRVVSRQECLRLFAGIEERGLTGGGIVYDCQMSSSERFLLAFARSAVRAGADIANYVEVTGFLRKGNRVTGVKARDVLAGGELDIRARIVVNTGGPWLDRVLDLLNGYRSDRRVVLSKAFNLLVNCQLIPRYALGVYSKGSFKDGDTVFTKRSRLFFITPWQDRSLIGTVHLPYDDDPDNFKVTEDEIQAFLDEVNAAYPAAGLKRHDVSVSYGGLLPAVGNAYGGENVELVRAYRISDHESDEGIEGLISVIGVKFTEARHVAEKVVDLVFWKLGKAPAKCATAFTPLHGGQIEQFNVFVADEMRRRSRGLSAGVIQHLVYQYGSAYGEVLKYFNDDLALSRWPERGSPLSVPSGEEGLVARSAGRGEGWGGMGAGSESDPPGHDDSLLRAEVLHGVREEMAQKLADLIFRRTGWGMTGHPGDACVRACASIMSKELGWDGVRTQSELEDVRAALPRRM